MHNSRVITYWLDSSSCIHAAMYAKKRVEYHSDHRDGYTPRRHTHKEITYTLDSTSLVHGAMHACGRKGTVLQSSVIIERSTPHGGACTRSRVITYTLVS